MAKQQLHALEHLKEVHCNSTDKHYHTLQHDCSICDYTSTDSNGIATEIIVYNPTVNTINYLAFNESVSNPNAFQDLPARAPPIL